MSHGFIVLSDDPGLREIQPGVCFYCQHAIGELHADDCVTIVKTVEYEVFHKHGESRQRLGLWVSEEPVSWDAAACEFHVNDGSWCANNMLPTASAVLRRALKPLQHCPVRSIGCLCSCMELKVVSMGDDARRCK